MRFFVCPVAIALLIVASCGSATAYDAGTAASTSDGSCGSSPSGCGSSSFGCCTDLVIAALSAGGWDTSSLSRGATALANQLQSQGWSSTDCTGASSCTPGDVLFYPNMGDGHVAMCSTRGKRNQWDPPGCGKSVDWAASGGLQCLSPPDSIRLSDVSNGETMAAAPTHTSSKCVDATTLASVVDKAVSKAFDTYANRFLHASNTAPLVPLKKGCDFLACASVMAKCADVCLHGGTSACLACVGSDWPQCCSCFGAC